MAASNNPAAGKAGILSRFAFARMTRVLPFFALALPLGCSSADDLAGYDKQSGDLGAFILRHASKFGARAEQTNGLPQFTADWRYKEDADGFQIYIVGDHFTQLQSFLTAAFGSPAKPPTTNELAGTKSIGTYYGPGLGAALNYGWEMTRDGKQFTSMVVVRAAALK
jgi:hypothetical protein